MKIVKEYNISGKRMSYNIDRWGKTENILIITGISGSGKTILAKQAAENRNAIHFSTDQWMVHNSYEKLESMRDLVTQEALDSLKATIEAAEEDINQLYVIEGILIYLLNSEEIDYVGIRNKPMIITDSSLNNIVESTRNKAIKREDNSSYPYIFEDELIGRMRLMADFLEELEKQS